MSRAYLSLGSNVNAERHISAAIEALGDAFRTCRLSPIYRSRAVGFDGDDFINLAAEVETDMNPWELRAWLRELEDRYGRDRTQPRYSDRTLDIDILLFDDRVIDSDELDVPRAEILKFAHVLKPLADLAPDLVHPTDGRTIAAIWEQSGLDDSVLEEIVLSIGAPANCPGKTP
jgi:2-amino-4-hydroxy-6-hydroxymethyldihydropteridine diphosphokinase